VDATPLTIAGAPPAPSAVRGLNRTDPRAPGITRVRAADGVRYLDPSGAAITDARTLARIQALAIPPAWRNVWISPDPAGHIQATGVDRAGRTQYRYHRAWRAQRDAQKFDHMLRFAGALPALRAATLRDLRRPHLDQSRVAASAVRLIDLGLFRLGGEKYAALDHHFGAATLEKQHVSIGRGAAVFDYVAKEGKHRAVTISDRALLATVRALARSDNGLDALFSWQVGEDWRPLHSHDVSAYIALRAGGHYTAKEFRTWNATVLTALLLANAGTPVSARNATVVINAAVRTVAESLGDTPAVTRSSYIDPRLISTYTADGRLAGVPVLPARLPAGSEAETAVAALLSGS
jgi:DNA topoisomerase I